MNAEKRIGSPNTGTKCSSVGGVKGEAAREDKVVYSLPAEGGEGSCETVFT